MQTKKYYCSICLIIRDENEYLKEWLEWHIGQGAEHFYIYDHGSKYSVKTFIQLLKLPLTTMITVVDWNGKYNNAQPEAYNDCLKQFGKENRWIGFIDADEHVRLKTGQTLPEFLQNYETYAGVFITWVMYGANGQKHKSDELLRQRFPQPTLVKTWSDKIGKVFVQPLLIENMVSHNGHPKEGYHIVGEYKDIVPAAQFWKINATTDLICIDHYYTKSYEEWLEKLRRGTCHSQYGREYREFFELNPDMEYCRENISLSQKYEISTK
ncbi:MAG: glycosyltransferase family 92 protein [Firmicutes bacterium]|nr:glycosyltransferase family 92 protein [Bacillota bacterium]